MPSFVTPSRRSRDESLDSEDNAAISTPPSSSSRGSKRARTNHLTNGTSSTVHQYQWRKPQDLSGKSIGNGDASTEHQPGSIVRVKLENFVTYASAEFKPGPSLNMVIGPNGTGKSTLVCAICLGLGWGPTHLGRAKEISEFVKHGSHEATIEIELKCDGRKFKRNPVIKTIIKKEGNKSLWTLNGRPSTRKQVLETAQSFSIQIDNLCQFLPQDRVVEFAAMSPVELLRSTQRAVAEQQMIDWYEELIEMRRNQRDVEIQNTADREQLAGLENRQRMQEADVQRIREREEVKEKIRLLEAVKPVSVYRAKRAEFEEAKRQKVEAGNDLNELEASVEPTLQAVNAKQDYRDAIQVARDDRRKVVADVERQADSGAKNIETLQSKAEECKNQMEREKKDAQQSRSEVKRLDNILVTLQRQLDQGLGDFDVTSCNEQLREKERKYRALEEEGLKIKEKMNGLNKQGQEANGKIKQAEKEIENLDSQAGQQEHKLSKLSPDTYKAWKWVRENQDQFEKPILGPPVIECSIKDPKYVDMIETMIQSGDMITLTAQTRNDQKKLHEIVKNQLRCGRTNTRCALPMTRFKTPISDEQRKALGFDGWAVDYVTGPEPVLAMLCEAAALHRTGVTFQDTTEEKFQQIQDSTIPQWVTSKSFYRVTRRREYGPGAVSTQVRDIRKAQVWTNQPVDLSIKQELRRKIAQWQDDVRDVKREFSESDSALKTIVKKRDDVKEEQKELAAEKDARSKAARNFNALPTRVAQAEEKRKESQEILDGLRDRLEDLQSKWSDLRLEKVRAALAYADAAEALQRAHDALQEAEVMFIEAQSDVEILERNNIDIKNSLEAKRRELLELENTMKLARKDAQRALAAVQKLKEEADPALTEFLENLPAGQTLEELEDEIDAERARLELMHGGDSNVIAQFVEREKKINKLRDKLERIDGALQEIGEKIAEVRQKWEPQLDALVKRISSSFSYNMEQIGCNGQVDVQKEEDFDQWAIIIHVRFREHEPLTRLDSHRQSGGERAVSTIFYLMSLQSLTRSPFRVVDEINQGMDPRNERLVHSRMVAIATGRDEWKPEEHIVERRNGHVNGEDDEEDEAMGNGWVNGHAADGVDGEVATQVEKAVLGTGGSQYFLVTPKLLHNLRYEEGMQVMCIVSGEHMLEPGQDVVQEVDFLKQVAIRGKLGRGWNGGRGLTSN